MVSSSQNLFIIFAQRNTAEFRVCVIRGRTILQHRSPLVLLNALRYGGIFHDLLIHVDLLQVRAELRSRHALALTVFEVTDEGGARSEDDAAFFDRTGDALLCWVALVYLSAAGLSRAKQLNSPAHDELCVHRKSCTPCRRTRTRCASAAPHGCLASDHPPKETWR